MKRNTGSRVRSRPAWVASCVLFSRRRSRGVWLGVEGDGSASKAILLLLMLVLVLVLGDDEAELWIRCLRLWLLLLWRVLLFWLEVGGGARFRFRFFFFLAVVGTRVGGECRWAQR